MPILVNRRTRIEPLESRLAMAGNVTASVVNGELRIDGDDVANWLVVRGTVNPGELTILGLDSTGAMPTTINGIASQTFSGVTGSIVMNLRGGDDVAHVKQAYIAGAVVIDLGAGNDTLYLGIEDNTNLPLSMVHELVVNAGEGTDGIVCDYVCGGSSMVTDFGTGTSYFMDTPENLSCFAHDYVIRASQSTLNLLTAYQVNHSGSMLIESGPGPDSLTFQFGRSVHGAILAGDGDDQVLFGQFLDGDAFIDLGGGNDISGGPREVAGVLTIVGAGGADNIVLEDGRFGTITINAGSEDDKVKVYAFNFDNLFVNVLNVDLAAGNDILTMQRDQVSVSATLDGGAGDDLWEELGNGIVGLTFRNFERYRFA